jgi:outer membrane protein assembly factor BamB
MTGICWWLVDTVSRLLAPDERDAVRGDFAELGVTGGQALCDVIGLVARRESILWKDWRPWLALFGQVGPLGVLLGQGSIRLSIVLSMYCNYRLGISAGMVCGALVLIPWSWTVGFVLGSLSRRAIWVNGALFYLIWLYGLLWGPKPPYGEYDVLEGNFYRIVLPLTVQAFVFLLPSIWGVHQGLRLGTLRVRQTIVVTIAFATMTALAIWTGGWWNRRLFSLAMVSWPVGYMIAMASARRWKSRALVFTAVFASVAAAVAQSSPQDYPQWRGRNRDGSASAFTEPKSWPESLTRRWKIDIGEGYATPIVIGDTVYSFTRRGGNEVMTALNAATGKIVWQTDYPAPYEMFSATRVHGSGPKATPLYQMGKLYTLGISGIVSAFNAASGKLAWQKPAPAVQPFYGAASSPAGEKNLVFFHPGSYGPLTAFEANTGAVRWTAKEGGAYASPILAGLGGIRQIVSMNQKSIAGFSLADGAVLWQHPWASRKTDNAITPILYGEMILVSGDLGVAALKPVARGGNWVADVVWETKDISLFLSNPVLIGDTLFGLSDRARGQFFALDAKTGKVLWLGEPRAATNTAVVKAGDLLFLLNDDGKLIVARSSRTGFEPLKQYTISDSATWAQPAISGNRLFVKDASSLALWTLD